MGKILIAIKIEGEELKLKHENISANAGDVALSISLLELLKIKQITNFEKLNGELYEK